MQRQQRDRPQPLTNSRAPAFNQNINFFARHQQAAAATRVQSTCICTFCDRQVPEERLAWHWSNDCQNHGRRKGQQQQNSSHNPVIAEANYFLRDTQQLFESTEWLVNTLNQLQHDGNRLVSEMEQLHVLHNQGAPKKPPKKLFNMATVPAKKGEDDCAICLSGLKKGVRHARLACGHFFHRECIQKWLEVKTQCPLCKRNL